MIKELKLSTVQKMLGLLSSVERRRAIVLLGFMLIGMVLETLGVGLVIPALALLTQKDFAHHYPTLQPIFQVLGNPNQQSLVIGGMLMLVGVYFVKTCFLALLAWRQVRFAYGLQAQLSQRLFEVYLRQPYTFHLQRNSAQLINTVNEVSSFTSNGIMPSMTLLTEGLVLFGLCMLLLAVEPLGTLIVVSILGVATFGFNRVTGARITKWGEARLHHDGLRIQHMQQGLGGIKDAILLGRVESFLGQYRTHNWQSVQVGQFQSTLQQMPRLWMELLAVSGLAILVISMLKQGGALESVLPVLGLFAAAAFRLIPSVNRILGAVQLLRYGLPVIDVLHKEFNLMTTGMPASRKSAMSFNNSLELNQVTYTYPCATRPALKNITLAIKRGESIGFIGTSGAGKSTLVDILLGLLTPDAGEVRVDGKNIQKNLRGWQDQIGYVPQSIFLTDDTLRRNVAFGLENEQIDDSAVRRAIMSAQLSEFIECLPDGLETIVGERGVRLSGGQRQRIGIARALYHDPAVLVLDEATSSLDTSTEQDVIQAVNALHGKKTILIVAHRLSTIEHCDQLYRLEYGCLVVDGNLKKLGEFNDEVQL